MPPDREIRVAALYVETGGVYYGLPDVDPWDEERDARLYAGPWPVVAHPPCARWSKLAHIHKHRWPIGDDGGCFREALTAVVYCGGVLEHPAGSLAFARFALPRPMPGSWQEFAWMGEPGAVTEVDQGRYGHRARKRTWLYAVGCDLPDLDWRQSAGSYPAENMNTRSGEASRTPPAFRDVLLDMARSAERTTVAPG